MTGKLFLKLAARWPYPHLLDRMRRRLGIQLNVEELQLISRAVRWRAATKLLVFGTGHDSEYWWRLNRQGRTVFLEDNLRWVEQARTVVPHLEIVPIVYGTYRSQWRDFLARPE